MDFIERLFGQSPDNGDGTLELAWLAAAAAVILLLVFRRRVTTWLTTRAARRQNDKP